MKKYSFSLIMMTPGNNANYTSRITYLETANEKFDEFSGETQQEVIEKATNAVNDWLNKM